MRSVTRGDLVLVFVMVIWGFNYVAIKLALREIEPLAFLTLRNTITLIVLLAIFLLIERRWTVRPQDLGRLLLIGIGGVTINQLSFNLGLKYTSAANAAILITTSPVFGLVFGIFLDREHVTRRRWLGAAAALIGVSLVVAGGQGGLHFGVDSLAGDLLILCGAASWALYSVLGRPILKVYSPLQLTTYATIVGWPFLLPVTAGAVVAQSWAPVSALGWAMTLYGGILISLTGVLWYRAVHKVGASRALIFMYLVPVFAVLSAMLVLGEGISIVQLAGAVIILAGVNVARQG